MSDDLHLNEQLVIQLRSDLPGAFEEVYNTYAAELLSYAGRRLTSLEEARDVVQDIFLSLYESRRELNIEVSLRAYLFAALKYKIIDHIRKNVHKKRYIDLVLSLDDHTGEQVINEIVYNDLDTILQEEVKRLPERVKETFLLSRNKHLSIPEIAAYMQVSEQTVKNQLTTALKHLRPVMEKVLVVACLLSRLH